MKKEEQKQSWQINSSFKRSREREREKERVVRNWTLIAYVVRHMKELSVLRAEGGKGCGAEALQVLGGYEIWQDKHV